MKLILLPFTNWRVAVLTVLAGVAFVLLFSETENIRAFLLGKVIGAAIAFVAYLLARYWDTRGKLSELADLVNEE